MDVSIDTPTAIKPLTARQRDMLELARAWAPYGGPAPSEIFISYGISIKSYRERIRRILTNESNGLTGAEILAIEAWLVHPGSVRSVGV